MKAYRQSIVLDLVDREAVTSQEQLRRRLSGRGVAATQATLSRDIKELGLVKRASDGAYRRPGPEAPARIARATLMTPAEGPPVIPYAAENLTDAELEQFTVMAFVFKPDGTLTARQVAPGRRTLEAHEVKYSTLVLDGSTVDRADIVVVGINQVQRAGSDAWWRTELQRAAEAAVPLKKK